MSAVADTPERSALVRLARLLSPEAPRSGEWLGNALGCTRAAVWKQVERLREAGIQVTAAPGQGYRLSEPIEWLDERPIRDALSPAADSLLRELRVLDWTDSTNARVKAEPRAAQHGLAVLAEGQTAGRGRRGRGWVSPFGRNVYLSLGWRFEQGAAGLGALPLAVAVAACRALDAVGLSGHRVKWPNDLQLGGRKLGGCLVEVQGDLSGPCHAVIGVGLNVTMPASAADAIDQSWADLDSALPGVSRNAVAAALLGGLLEGMDAYAADGFSSFQSDWRRLDALQGRTVSVHLEHSSARGVARGVTAQGALRVDTRDGPRQFVAGEVSVRRA